MYSSTSSRNTIAPVVSGKYGEPASAANSVRFPPTSRPLARPGTMGCVRNCRTASVPLRNRGLRISGASPSKTTRRISRVVNSLHGEVAFGPWKPTRFERASSASSSEVMSL